MEAEEAASKKLEDLGYTIFYRNLLVKYKGNSLCEFDIILANCIVEVKSGKCLFKHSKAFPTIIQHNLIPKHMTFYVYCLVKTDEEIAELNAEINRTNVIFINRLEEIATRHPQDNRKCVIKQHATAAHFMNRQLETILKFSKIYIHPTAYNELYMQYNYARDSYSTEENLMWSAKLRLLQDTERLVITEDAPEDAYELSRGPVQSIYNERFYIKTLQTLKILIYHNLTAMPRTKDMEDLYINCYDMRTHTELKEPPQNIT